MPRKGQPSPARLLAPFALALFALALGVVVVTSNPSDDRDGAARGSVGERRPARSLTPTEPEGRRRPATYTVETGDTLGAIAEETRVSVERLQELNPELDPQALVSGQRIKLRE